MKRQRGRGRKPSNPGNRSYESNGPDVKIRGNANQIYEKYLQYARDAQTSGDRIAAEAYFQHAEHYYRIMAANMPKDKLPIYQDDQDGMSDDDGNGDQADNESGAEASSNERENGAQGEVSGLQVVDGEGEQPEEIKSGDSDGERPSRRRGRSRRKPASSEQSSASESAPEGDDAGLRAMMARSTAPEVPADTAQAEG